MNRKWNRISIADNDGVDISFHGDQGKHFPGVPGELATTGQLHVVVVRDDDVMRVVVEDSFGQYVEVELTPANVLAVRAAKLQDLQVVG